MRTGADVAARGEANVQVDTLRGPSEHGPETTQIYEGTNQIQRVVMAKRLLGG